MLKNDDRYFEKISAQGGNLAQRDCALALHRLNQEGTVKETTMKAEGLAGRKAKLREQIELRGALELSIVVINSNKAEVTVSGTLLYRKELYNNAPLVRFSILHEFPPEEGGQDKIFVDEVTTLDLPSLKQIKLFRTLLIRKLRERLEEAGPFQPDLVKRGLQCYIKMLENYNEFRVMKDGLKNRIDRLDHERPEDQEKIKQIYAVLGVIPFPETPLVEV